MMASKLSLSPWFSVYLFQIIIYLITVLCLIFLSINKSGTSKLIIAALGFLLLFSDPSSVGPQSFPSSGLFRFSL